MLKINMALSETKVLYLNILLFSIFFNVKGTFIWYTPFSATHTHTTIIYNYIYICICTCCIYSCMSRTWLSYLPAFKTSRVSNIGSFFFFVEHVSHLGCSPHFDAKATLLDVWSKALVRQRKPAVPKLSAASYILIAELSQCRRFRCWQPKSHWTCNTIMNHHLRFTEWWTSRYQMVWARCRSLICPCATKPFSTRTTIHEPEC